MSSSDHSIVKEKVTGSADVNSIYCLSCLTTRKDKLIIRNENGVVWSFLRLCVSLKLQKLPLDEGRKKDHISAIHFLYWQQITRVIPEQNQTALLVIVIAVETKE